MIFESFISKRYLISKHKISFITVISFLSIFGITIGVAALIIVLSIFNGFSSLVTSILVNFDPHVKIESKLGEGIEDYGEVEKELVRNPLVKYYSPYVNGKVVIYSDRLVKVVSLTGISDKSDLEFNGLKRSIIAGSYNLETINNLPRLLIGLSLAVKLQAVIGDTVTIVSPVGIENVISSFAQPKIKRFLVSGIFSSNNKDYDAVSIYSELKEAQDLLGYDNKINGFEIRGTDISSAEPIKLALKSKLDENIFEVKTWFDLHKQLYSVMLIERWAAYIILSLIIAVATFSIFGSLIMTVIEKKRDIGILKSMGANNNSILKIFLLEGILIGIIGTILGLIIGLIVCYLQIEFKIYPLDPTIYIIDALPVEIRVTDVIAIGISAIFLSTIAGLYPARKASKTVPLEAIRWE